MPFLLHFKYTEHMSALQNIIKSFHNLTAIQEYCNPSVNAPTLQYANTRIATTSVGSKTFFTCLPGYESSDPSSLPFFTCSTDGKWSGITHSCQRVQFYSLTLSV